MDGDTAVLEADTAALAETPPADALPETETGEAAPETGATETTPETEATGESQEPLRWAGMTPEQIEAEVQKAINDVRARTEESYRRKAETERQAADERAKAEAFEMQRRSAVAWRQQESYQTFASIAKALEEGKELKDLLPALRTASARNDAAAVVHAQQLFTDSLNGWLSQHGLTLKPEVIARYNRAANVFDSPAQALALLDGAMEALTAKLEPELAGKVEKELKTRAAKEREAAQLAKAGETRAAQARPTTGFGGGGAPRALTLQEIDDMPTNEWLSIPKAERDKLLADAHGRAQRGR